MINNYSSPDLNSKKYSAKFDKYSDFQLWLQLGGRYLKNLFSYLGNVSEPTQYDYNLLQILYVLLDDKVNEILHAKFGPAAIIRNTMKENEIKRLRSVQNTLSGNYNYNNLCFIIIVIILTNFAL